MASPHPGMHVLCPVCEGPIPDLLGELTEMARAAGLSVTAIALSSGTSTAA